MYAHSDTEKAPITQVLRDEKEFPFTDCVQRFIQRRPAILKKNFSPERWKGNIQVLDESMSKLHALT